MPTMNVNLTEHLADFVRREVDRGAYQNASECVRDALRLLARDREEHEAKLAALRDAVAVSLAEADRGEAVEMSVEEITDQVFRAWEQEDEAARRPRRRA